MRIGHNDNSLNIEKVGKESGPIWRIEAMVIGAGWMFAGMYERVMVNALPGTAREMAQFAELESREFEVGLSEGGWLRFKRGPRGHILIRYRLGRLQAGAALEGEVVLEGEAASSFCKGLSALL
jgi:hypothetical protein